MTSSMQCHQMVKTPPQEQWTEIFPDFTTVTGSSLFIKKLIAVSLSSLTFIRGVFPDKAYGERSLKGLKLKILTEATNIPAVKKFISLIKSCYDAIDKKYLQQLNIGICLDPENKEEVLESYCLNFRYNDSDFSIGSQAGISHLSDDDPTVEGTLLLLKSIIGLNDLLTPLPKTAYLTIKLLYYDEITPENYEPPGFEPANSEKYLFPSNAVKFKLGGISTDFNGYKMYLKTALIKEPLSQLYQQTLYGSQESRLLIRDEPCDGEEDVIQTESNSNIGRQSRATKSIPEKIECPCTCKQDSETDTLQCLVCKSEHHAVCYGFLRVQNESEFYCVQCIQQAPTNNTDLDMIYTSEGTDQQELCALRRALAFCVSTKEVTTFLLQKNLKCDKPLAKNLIQQLELEGYIKKTSCGSREKYIVNEKMIINQGFPEYFHENKENLEKLELSKTKQPIETVDLEVRKNSPEKFSYRSKGLFSKEDKQADFDINKEVKKMNLNLKGVSEQKRPLRVSKRKCLKELSEDDDEEEIIQPPKKRRAKQLSAKETIILKK